MQPKQIRKIDSRIDYIAALYKRKEIQFKDADSFEPKHAEQSIDLLFRGLQPNIIILVDDIGDWEVVAGSHFAQGIVEYVNDKHVYPTTGVVKQLQGKRFSELCSIVKRMITTVDLHAMIKDVEFLEQDELEFERLLQITKKFS